VAEARYVHASRREIPDALAVRLAQAWWDDYSQPGVIEALVERGYTQDQAVQKVRDLARRRILTYSTSPNYSWPRRLS
jgi:hypothetical protein